MPPAIKHGDSQLASHRFPHRREGSGPQLDHGLVTELGGFIYLRAKLNNLSALPLCPFQRYPEVRRDVKLNYLRHAYLLMRANLCGPRFAMPSNSSSPQ